ncbi:MAG: MarR family transcriptional regulator [Herbinix sp.]|nr:MarR family transcriptional regulator [Herbinix sp.]
MGSDLKELLGTLSEIMKYIHQRSYHTMNHKQVYPGQPKLLTLIKANEGITQKDLSEKNCVTPATITGVLSKLEANHYVYRVPDETDKRILRVYLTPEGRELAEHAELFMASLIEQLFAGFDGEEIQTLMALSQKIKNNIITPDTLKS